MNQGGIDQLLGSAQEGLVQARPVYAGACLFPPHFSSRQAPRPWGREAKGGRQGRVPVARDRESHGLSLLETSVCVG